MSINNTSEWWALRTSLDVRMKVNNTVQFSLVQLFICLCRFIYKGSMKLMWTCGQLTTTQWNTKTQKSTQKHKNTAQKTFGFYYMRWEVGGTMASGLVHLCLDQAVWFRALARNTALCSWARHFILSWRLFTEVHKLVPANLMLGVSLRWTGIASRGSGNIASCVMLQKPW